MVVVDANVLLYAVNASMPHHEPARRWIEGALSADEPIGFAWVVLLAFLRVSTMPALFPRPLPVGEAFQLVDDWLAAPTATIVHPTGRHADLLRGFLLESGTAGNLTMDAHLAALTVEHGARLCTFDRDFAQFDGVFSFTPGAS